MAGQIRASWSSWCAGRGAGVLLRLAKLVVAIPAYRAMRGLNGLLDVVSRLAWAGSGIADEQPASEGEPGVDDAVRVAFVASAQGSRYHRPGCRWARNIRADNLVCFATARDALDYGYEPCRTCCEQVGDFLPHVSS